MIVIASQTPGGGSVMFPSASLSPDSSTARIDRSKTLDCDAVFVLFGTTHADRTFTIKGGISRDDAAIVRGWYEGMDAVTVATHEGLFEAYISRFSDGNGQAQITLLIKGKAS
jgi:hypothetical protein